MSSKHELATAGIVVLLILVMAFSNALAIPGDVIEMFKVSTTVAIGWLFRGRINGMTKTV